MALTKNLKHTIAERAQREPAFAQALLDEAAILRLSGEPEIAQAMLHCALPALRDITPHATFLLTLHAQAK